MHEHINALSRKCCTLWVNDSYCPDSHKAHDGSLPGLPVHRFQGSMHTACASVPSRTHALRSPAVQQMEDDGESLENGARNETCTGWKQSGHRSADGIERSSFSIVRASSSRDAVSDTLQEMLEDGRRAQRCIVADAHVRARLPKYMYVHTCPTPTSRDRSQNLQKLSRQINPAPPSHPPNSSPRSCTPPRNPSTSRRSARPWSKTSSTPAPSAPPRQRPAGSASCPARAQSTTG